MGRCGLPTAGLLDDTRLSASSVVANSAMNRERGLTGVNSYARELGFDPLATLLGTTPEPGRRTPAAAPSAVG